MNLSPQQEFARLLGYVRASKYSPRFKGITKRQAKSLGKTPQGRCLVGLDRVFLKGEYKR